MGMFPSVNNVKVIWESYTNMGMAEDTHTMSRRRALLTDRERELIAGENVTDDTYRYQAASRIRNKIDEELTEDIEILREHHPQLLSELRDVVCTDD
jgi:hypothetical protein